MSKKRCILYVITKSNWGGAQKYVYELAVASKEAGYEVTVACGTQGELSERLESMGIPVLTIQGLARDINPLSDLQAFESLMKIMRELKPDVVHANSSKAGLLAVMAANSVGVRRIVFTAHGWAFNESRPFWQKGIFALFHLLTVWLSDVVICVSEAVKRDAGWMPFSEKKMRVIHHGIELVQVEEKTVARASLALYCPGLSTHIENSAQQQWIGTLAELHPTKGLDIAIEAFSRIATQFPNTLLVLIGEGQERARLVKLAKERGLAERICFCGHVKNAPTLLSAFDIFLFPSRSEALGFAVLEAGNASLPIIASRVGGIPEIIEDNMSGLLVSANDVGGFTKALTSLLESPGLCTSFGTALHQKITTEFSQMQMIEKTLSFYS